MSGVAHLQLPLPQTLRRSYEMAPTNLHAGWTPRELWAQSQWRQEWDPGPLRKVFSVVRETMHLPIDALHGGLVDSEPVHRMAADIRQEVMHGTGVVWLRGLNGLSEPYLRRMYALLSSMIGEPIDTYGRLYDVQDRGLDHTTQAIPVSQTRAETSFHTDSSNVSVEPAIIGLLCVRAARSGGTSLISSAHQAHQSLPEEVRQVLYRDFVRNIVTPGLNGSDIIRNRFPVFRWTEEGGLVMRYMRYWIEKGHERLGWPLTAAEVAAMDALDAALTRNAVAFDMGAGDMTWINNRTLAHNRTSFDDDPARPRLLVRMWLG